MPSLIHLHAILHHDHSPKYPRGCFILRLFHFSWGCGFSARTDLPGREWNPEPCQGHRNCDFYQISICNSSQSVSPPHLSPPSTADLNLTGAGEGEERTEPPELKEPPEHRGVCRSWTWSVAHALGSILSLSSPFKPFFFEETNYSHIKNYPCKENIHLYCAFLIISVLKSREKPCRERQGLG